MKIDPESSPKIPKKVRSVVYGKNSIHMKSQMVELEDKINDLKTKKMSVVID